MFIYFFYISIAIIPSLIWLLYYLREDIHPEPKWMIIKIFLWGMLMGPLAVVLEFGIRWLMHPVPLKELLKNFSQSDHLLILSIILVAPIVEEYLKYTVIKYNILRNSNFDEPLDLMIYGIVAALGFAAAENTLITLAYAFSSAPLKNIVANIVSRFISATFIHALATATLAYYLAVSLHQPQKKFLLSFKGLSLAIILHSSYNYLAWLSQRVEYIFILIILLITFMAVFVSWQFKQLKKMLSICSIQKFEPEER